MGLFGKSKKEREKEYMNRLDVPLCLKEDFELIIDDVFTIMGVGTVATGNISTGMCREGENACVYKTNGGVLETIITTIDIHTKERKSNGCGYKIEHVGLDLLGEIIICAFGEEILCLLVDLQAAVPPPRLIGSGGRAFCHAVVIELLSFQVGKAVRAIQHLRAKWRILTDADILTI